MVFLSRVGLSVLAGMLLLIFNVAAFSLGCVVYFYLLPGVIASKRGYAGAGRIYLICAIAGWTVLVWLGALLFALSLPPWQGEADGWVGANPLDEPVEPGETELARRH